MAWDSLLAHKRELGEVAICVHVLQALTIINSFGLVSGTVTRKHHYGCRSRRSIYCNDVAVLKRANTITYTLFKTPHVPRAVKGG